MKWFINGFGKMVIGLGLVFAGKYVILSENPNFLVNVIVYVVTFILMDVWHNLQKKYE